MPSKLSYLLPLFLLSLSSTGCGQDPFYINYDTNDGLPSSEAYYVHAAQDGLIWITTDRGISSYNGYEFKAYTTQEGISHNTNFRIFEDPKNRLWFTAWDGSLTLYEDGKFRIIPTDSVNIDQEQKGYATQLMFDDEHNVFMTRDIKGSLEVGELFEIDTTDFSLKKQSVYQLGKRLWTSEDEKKIIIKLSDEYLYFDGRYHFSVNVEPVKSGSLAWLIGFNNSALNLLVDGELTNLYPIIGDEVYNFFLDPKNNLWLCTPNGLLLYQNADLEQEPQRFFQGLEITSITMDREGSYWMTSREKGVFWIPSFQVHTLLRPKKDFEIQHVLSIGKLPNHLLLGTVNNGVIAVDKKFDLEPLSRGWDLFNETRRMYPEEHTYYGKDFNMVKEVDGKLMSLPINDTYNSQTIKEIDDDLFFSIKSKGYGIYLKNNQAGHNDYGRNHGVVFREVNEKAKRVKVRMSCIGKMNDTLFIGAIDGLYKLPMEGVLSDIPYKDTMQMMNTRIEDIICVDTQSIWFATIGNGLIYKSGHEYTQLLQGDGLSSNMINKICLENDSILWVGSNKGLDKIHFAINQDKVNVLSVSNYSTDDGLVSNFINDVVIWKQHVWLATNKGLSYFQPEEIVENKIAPLIRIEKVLVGDRITDPNLAGEFNYEENDFEFNFLGVSFKKPENKSFYSYSLSHDGGDPVWYPTNNKSVRFLDLSPGKYTFEVMAKNKNGYWSPDKASYSFVIKPHFTEQLWFLITVWFLIVLTIGLGVFYRIRTIRFREEQKRKLKEAELAGLRNQMNPHFVFNSLNSIQNFVFHQDVKKANYYLSKFSALMRSSLEYSGLKYISISEEVNYLRSYMELEKLRFDDLFEFNIQVADDIPVHHYFIPPLLLQPVIENSVKHAFKQINHKGKINVQFLRHPQDNMIEIYIVDNGVGIKNTEKRNYSNKHKSMGISIVRDRIKLLNPEGRKTKASFEIKNYYKPTGDIAGVKACFVLPVKINKHD